MGWETQYNTVISSSAGNPIFYDSDSNFNSKILLPYLGLNCSELDHISNIIKKPLNILSWWTCNAACVHLLYQVCLNCRILLLHIICVVICDWACLNLLSTVGLAQLDFFKISNEIIATVWIFPAELCNVYDWSQMWRTSAAVLKIRRCCNGQ